MTVSQSQALLIQLLFNIVHQVKCGSNAFFIASLAVFIFLSFFLTEEKIHIQASTIAIWIKFYLSKYCPDW